MALSNLFGWSSNAQTSPAASCGVPDKPAEAPAACGVPDKPAEAPAACGVPEK